MRIYPHANLPHPLKPGVIVPAYPSVTSLLGLLDKLWMAPWAAKECINYIRDNAKPEIFEDDILFETFLQTAKTAYKRISKEATDIGTEFHSQAEIYLRTLLGQPPSKKMSTDSNVLSMLAGFIKWCKKHEVEPIAIEQVVYGPGYAGRFDLLAYLILKGKRLLTVCDIKTSKQYYPEMGEQLSAYRAGHYDYSVIPVNGRKSPQAQIIIRVDKKSHRTNFKDYSDRYNIDRRRFFYLVQRWWVDGDIEKEIAKANIAY